jgi:hypothetical protein
MAPKSPEVFQAQARAIARKLIDTWLKEEAAVLAAIATEQERLVSLRARRRELEKAYPAPDDGVLGCASSEGADDADGPLCAGIDAVLSETPEGLSSSEILARFATGDNVTIHVVRAALSRNQKAMGWFHERRGKGSVWKKQTAQVLPLARPVPEGQEVATG